MVNFNNEILVVENISKTIDKKIILNGITFSMRQGDILGIVGPNGSGKTTLLTAISGILKIDKGQISIADEIKLGALIDEPIFYDHLTGYENLKLVGKIRNINISKPDILDILEKVNLKNDANKKFKNYSYGMRQRLGIAGAIFNNANLVILDEPTNGVDPMGIRDIREIIQKLNYEGKTFIVTSHNLSEIEIICSHLLILKEGNVIFGGLITDLQKSNNTTNVELGCENMKNLREEILKMPKFIEIIKENEEFIIISVMNDISLAEVNSWCYEHNINLSRLRIFKDDLESKVLDLL
ncbi:MAG: ABC transporter ATP-binding protein [Arcicella sp.]|nr:ABC transporter ATP-binding protein [Arcicella sp.]